MTTRTPAAPTTHATPSLRNWDGSIVARPHVIVSPRSVDEIVAIMKDRARYPSPVRAIGSNHSTTFCTVSDGGTAVLMEPHFHRVVRFPLQNLST